MQRGWPTWSAQTMPTQSKYVGACARVVAASAVREFYTAILRVYVFSATLSGGLFLAKAHGFHLAVLNAQEPKRASHGFGALLTQCQVVFAATAFVCMAFNHDLAALTRFDKPRMDFDEGLKLGLDHVAVVVKVHDAADSHRARAVTAGLVQVHTRYTTLACIARIRTGVCATHGG